jgi:hypothetical protein
MCVRLLILIFIIGLCISVPPFGFLIALFYIFWWLSDSDIQDEPLTTEVTVTTFIGGYPMKDVRCPVVTNNNTNVGEFQIKR